ncbi:hypothetical protein EWS82_10870 [Staphylococcus xylosus]|nr:hypothetical protein [Staphylococcus xylosus]
MCGLIVSFDSILLLTIVILSLTSLPPTFSLLATSRFGFAALYVEIVRFGEVMFSSDDICFSSFLGSLTSFFCDVFCSDVVADGVVSFCEVGTELDDACSSKLVALLSLIVSNLAFSFLSLISSWDGASSLVLSSISNVLAASIFYRC